MSKNIVVDVDDTMTVMQMIFTNGTDDQITEILERIDVMRDEFGYGTEIKTSELLADVVRQGLADFTDDLEDYVNEKWIPIGEAAKNAGISASTISRRAEAGEISMVRRGKRNNKFVLQSEVDGVELKKDATHTGPRKKKQKRANPEQIKQRTSVVMDALSDGRSHSIRSVIDVMMENSDYHFNKDPRDTAYKLLAKLIDDKQVAWQPSNGNKNPRMGDMIYLPTQKRLFDLRRPVIKG